MEHVHLNILLFMIALVITKRNKTGIYFLYTYIYFNTDSLLSCSYWILNVYFLICCVAYLEHLESYMICITKSKICILLAQVKTLSRR